MISLERAKRLLKLLRNKNLNLPDGNSNLKASKIKFLDALFYKFAKELEVGLNYVIKKVEPADKPKMFSYNSDIWNINTCSFDGPSDLYEINRSEAFLFECTDFAISSLMMLCINPDNLKSYVALLDISGEAIKKPLLDLLDSSIEVEALEVLAYLFPYVCEEEESGEEEAFICKKFLCNALYLYHLLIESLPEDILEKLVKNLELEYTNEMLSSILGGRFLDCQRFSKQEKSELLPVMKVRPFGSVVQMVCRTLFCHFASTDEQPSFFFWHEPKVSEFYRQQDTISEEVRQILQECLVWMFDPLLFKDNPNYGVQSMSGEDWYCCMYFQSEAYVQVRSRIAGELFSVVFKQYVS